MEMSPYVILLLVFSCVFNVEAIRFLLGSNQRKCLREEIHKNVLVTGEYEVQDNGQRADLTVSFHVPVFLILLERSYSQGGVAADREVFLNLKHGIEAKNYEDIAKAEKLKPLEVELRRLEDLSKSIVDDFAYMRAREEQMRDTNGIVAYCIL
uniref:GOLD domain-containing protein n=1 Tax=Biomphalaria glabrata TaxID=6526 RepID=A0A2C9JPM0_BIOGL